MVNITRNQPHAQLFGVVSVDCLRPSLVKFASQSWESRRASGGTEFGVQPCLRCGPSFHRASQPEPASESRGERAACGAAAL